MTVRIKILAATIACMCAGATSAAATPDLGGKLHFDFQFPQDFAYDLLADATPGTTRAFAFAGTSDMLANSEWSRFMHTELGDGGKVVKDAPYSAEAITETTQLLQDGNRISRKTAALLYRDAMGRTRQEQTAPGNIVFINDPVAGKRTILNAEKKTATVLPDLSRLGDQIDIEKIKELAKSTAKAHVIKRMSNGEGSEVISNGDGEVMIRKSGPDGETTHVIEEPGRRIVIRRREATKADGTKAVEESKDVRISVVRAHGGDEAIAIAGLPLDINALVNMKTKNKGVTSLLGTKDFGGVKAEGSQTIATIPAGEIGNDKPIQIISEKWFSPELQAVVYSRHSDPRSGETIYRLNNIRRTAQPADLFAVPQGFQVKDRPLSMSGVPVPPVPPVAPVPPATLLSPAPLAPPSPAPK